MKTVAIIDFRMGNLFSVNQAIKNVGLLPIITNEIKVIEKADAIVLPGVGAFAEAMFNLSELNLTNLIVESIQQAKPFMGICLGFQLLFSKSEEFGQTDGLRILDGVVKKFKFNEELKKRVKVPQIGWNKIMPFNENKWNASLLSGVGFNEFMYFVHSFYVDTSDEDIILTKTNYEGTNFCSSIEYKNIFASQFHPEKSAREGMKIYKNFANRINNKV